ncbi:amyloid-beta-like protein isoform X4 [Bombus bifarius]|uniref:Amyloid-beta-like protein isoform X4 n=1 Tax=Bombus bifarius TaxID=103933 RepID=A0A6P8M2P2_9HYME|nr:amyloid-beta-like protein isoform X4 [Bombus vancouverensis nearcticus]XP_033307736.1 amyloid-beta-like protein isoform X4 [Bombus bifarius]XP_050476618.1 amyloid-beta-like protein isoform X4 [Bombus huntii]
MKGMLVPALLGVLMVCRVQAVSERLELAPAGGRSEPQVATLCEAGEVYLAQHMGEQGRWVSSADKKSCMTDKLEILEYCKKAYPKRDITNIVESSHYVRVNGWCKPGRTKCKLSRWVKPYRCLEGPFQSDALLVPEGCLFDHLHNQTKCWESHRWNATAADTCRERNMNLRSFAMLLPCGISLFSGVEFVCCPKHLKENMKAKKPIDLPIPKGMDEDLDEDEDDLEDDDGLDTDADDEDDSEADPEDVLSDQPDDDESDEEYLDDYNYDTTTSRLSTTVSTTEKPKQDVTAMPLPVSTSTQQSSQSQSTPDPYLTHFDPRSEHQSYKQAQMRLEEVHKEKVTKEAVKQRNEEAMSCYTAALNETPPNMHRIQKCLQKLLRALHKDRHHTIAHYKHLLDSSLEQAQREKPATLEHLAEIDRITNQSLLMLERYPDLSAKIGRLMDDYVLALRSKDETPGLLLAMTREAEAAILDKYQADVTSKQQEKEHQKLLERVRKEQRKAERGELRTEQAQQEENDSINDNKDIQQPPEQPSAVAAMHSEGLVRAAHSMTHDISHSEPGYSVRREMYHRESRSVYFTLAFAGIALMAAAVVGVAVFKRRSARSPHSQGFIEVDQAATPEERHVANMQINGYENPTYKYFEIKE